MARELEREGDGEPDDKGLLNRRAYLKLGATAAAVATGAGAMSTTGAAAEDRGITFDRTLDAVEDLGMDPTGGTPIDSALSSAMQSGTLVEFPPGEYLVTEAHEAYGIDNFGLKGTGSSPSDVTFVFPDGNGGAADPANFVMLWIDAGTGLLLENFELHQTDDKVTGASLVVYAEDKLELHDVVWQGFNPHADYAKGTCCYPSVTTTDGVGHVTGVEITGGGVVGTYPDRRMGFLMQSNHVGELIFSDVDIRELGSTAIRGTRCSGAVKIEDSYFENNDNGSIRFGAGDHPTKQSWAKRNKVVVDGDRVQHLESGESYEDIDACRIDSNGQGWTGALVEDCEFVYRSLPGDLSGSRGVITRPGWGDHGGFTVRDCTLLVDADGVPPVNAVPPGGDADQPEGVTLENVHITGQQASNYQDAVVCIQESDASSVENCCISLPNGGLSGVHIEGSSDCAVTSSDIYVGGDATDFVDSTVETSDLSSDGACRLPGDTTSDSGTDSGSTDDGSGDTTTGHTLSITGTGTPTNYAFTVDGELRADPDYDDLESWDTISGSSADGWVTETTQQDHFRFTGSVTAFSFVQGEADLTLDGQSVTVDELLGNDGTSTDDWSDSTTDSSLPNALSVSGTGSPANYQFWVTDAVEADPDYDDLESWDTVSGASADGWVTETTQQDHFRYAGRLIDFTFASGEADVAHDGTQVDPADLGLSNTLEIVGYGSEAASYEVTVSDLVAPDPKSDQSPDVTPGSSVEDAVTEGTHTFLFDGDVTFFDLTGPAAVYVNGTQVDPDALGGDGTAELPNKVVVDGTGTGATDYEFEVTGDIEHSTDLGSAETSDVTTDGTVTGSVDGDVDGFRFSGDLVSMQTDGSVSIVFEDTDG